MPGTSFFEWPKPWVISFLKGNEGPIAFVPFAAVGISFDTYFEKVSEAFGSIGYVIESVHRSADKLALIRRASAIVVGGGNTFALLSRVYEHDLLAAVRQRVAEGARYIGWSAGANLACPTLKTTNDMPVVMPPSFDALDLVPFQINPHYHELRFEGQGGETRRERIEEFLLMNPDKKVVGLPEGMLIHRDGDKLSLLGTGAAMVYEAGEEPRAVDAGSEADWLLS